MPLPPWARRLDFARAGADEAFHARQRAARRSPVGRLHEEFAAEAERALREPGAPRCDAGHLDGGVLCVSLASCAARREHTLRELGAWGLPRRAPAVEADLEVLEWYNSDRVAKYPPCFRCGGIMTCLCPNNVLLVEQVANWLSFRRAWRTMAEGPHDWYLLVEDDVKFTRRAAECWNALVTPALLQRCSGLPCIVRCGWQLWWDYVDDLPPELAEGVVRMSNHCSVLNRSMAADLLQASDRLLSDTSDVFVHERVAPRHRISPCFPPSPTTSRARLQSRPPSDRRAPRVMTQTTPPQSTRRCASRRAPCGRGCSC
ncbi:unnamed protein product [Prorocentrum cordatum]|uniref:Hexosyltransferase n=1 Tax=Prorocentrum cordatum TaxID=2364126 RepID=A0ABN9VVK4_9DINO|nr:unnamed protein product [Polarella glacialis]